MLMIFCILMENDRAVQQRQPVGNNEQREQVRKSEANTGNEDEIITFRQTQIIQQKWWRPGITG